MSSSAPLNSPGERLTAGPRTVVVAGDGAGAASDGDGSEAGVVLRGTADLLHALEAGTPNIRYREVAAEELADQGAVVLEFALGQLKSGRFARVRSSACCCRHFAISA